MQIQRINRLDLGISPIADLTKDDENELRGKKGFDPSNKGGQQNENESNLTKEEIQLRRVKKLEEKVHQLGVIVNGLFLKYDQQMDELSKN